MFCNDTGKKVNPSEHCALLKREYGSRLAKVNLYEEMRLILQNIIYYILHYRVPYVLHKLLAGLEKAEENNLMKHYLFIYLFFPFFIFVYLAISLTSMLLIAK